MSRTVTPEAVPLDFETAHVGSRALALLLDLAITGAVTVALVIALVATDGATGGLLPGWLAVTALTVVVLGIQFAYPIGFETLWHGRTPGKAALGLRVVTTEGGPVGFRHAAIRAALLLVDLWVAFGGIGVIVMLLTPRSQRLGDLAAGTIVLRERTGQVAPRSVTFHPPPGLDGYVATLDASALTADAYGAIRAFLLRAPSLPPTVRTELARELAGPIRSRVAVPPPEGVGPETFLACVAAAYQQRHRSSVPGPTPSAPGTSPGPSRRDFEAPH